MNTSTSIAAKFGTARRARPVAIATLLCVLGTAPTWAAPTSITVSFRDLDLSSIAGATTLYHRIQSAARQVCGTAPETDLIGRAAWQTCYRNSTADAVRKVNNPLLTAVHAGRKPEMTAMLQK
jgi:UrcA family protein